MARRKKFPAESMNILYFATHPLWPANTGARLRDGHLARQLGARARVTFVEMCRAGESSEARFGPSLPARVVTLRKPRPYTPWKILRGLAGPSPVTVLNCWSRGAASLLTEALRGGSYDTVQIEGVHLMDYLPVIRRAPSSPAVVVDWHNIESEAMERYAAGGAPGLNRAAARRTATLLARAEDRLLDACVTHTVTSERERHILLGRRPGADVYVIANGVDADFYSAANPAEAARHGGAAPEKKNILFAGSMDYHANIDAVLWFARTAWPEIAQAHPELQFTIVGRDPAREVRALASARIQVTGTVEDVRPYYAAAAAAVVPIRRGGGTRLKILEAMAAGVPVISTPLGAEGIEAENGAHLLLAEGAAEMAAAVRLLLLSAELRSSLARAGQSLARRKYDWPVIGAQLFKIHERLAELRRPAKPGKALAS
jgi:glycosyltransferase involved in cell wall biosynthesis